jgi:DNA-binding MarR family transcriptional regulator
MSHISLPVKRDYFEKIAQILLGLPAQPAGPNISLMQLLPLTTNRVSAEACAAEMLDALPPLMRVVRKHMRSHRAHGLSVPQFRVMAFLRTQPAAKLSMVAEFLGASMPTTSRIVSGLVSKGLVHRRQRCKDRRCVDLALTVHGTSVTEKARRATRTQLAGELAGLDESQRQAILTGMQSLRSLFAPAMKIAEN